MTPAEQRFAHEMIDAGHSPDDVITYLKERKAPERTDPRQDTRLMRPNVSGPDEDPADPIMTTVRGRRLPARLAHTDPGYFDGKYAEDTGDPLDSGHMDPTTTGVLAGTMGSGVAAGARAIGAPAILSGGAGGLTASAASGGDWKQNIAGLLLGMVPGAGAAASDAIRSPIRRSGREIARIEQAGGRAAVTKGIPKGDVGTGQMATAEEANVADAVGRRQMAADERLQSELEPVAQDLGRRPIATTGAIAELDAVRGQSRGGAGPTLAPSDNHLADVQSQLRGAESTADLAYAPPPEGVWSRNRMQALLGQGGPGAEVNTFGELRALHKAENEIAAKAMTDPTLPGGAAQQAAGAVRKVIRGNEIPGGGHTTDPRVAPALDAYAGEQDALRSIDDKLYSSDEAIPPTREAKKVAGARKLASAGTESKAQQPVEAQLDELAALDPVASAAVRRMRGRNAAEATRFGLPPPSGSLANTVARGVRQNADAAVIREFYPDAQAFSRAPPGAVVSPLLRFLLGQTNEQETTDGRR